MSQEDAARILDQHPELREFFGDVLMLLDAKRVLGKRWPADSFAGTVGLYLEQRARDIMAVPGLSEDVINAVLKSAQAFSTRNPD